MENATKALLIAAAVLVVILIISLGIGLFNMAKEQVDNAGDLSEYQIQQHNDKFTKYEGTARSGSDVNALLTTVFNHNNAQADNSTCVAVTVNLSTGTNPGVAAANNLTTSPTKVSTGARFTVVATYSQTTKLINTIAITQNT